MVFCNKDGGECLEKAYYVTILILIDGFLQLKLSNQLRHRWLRHNPYFNRWFSAIILNGMDGIIPLKVTILILIDGFLQYR